MARPTRLTINNGENAWDSKLNTNHQNWFDRPAPIALHTGDESDIEATYPAASYDKCFIWVDHTTKGWRLYYSDGADWLDFLSSTGPMTIQVITTTDTVDSNENILAVCTGTTYTVTLPDASDVGAGHRVTVKRSSTGDITVDGAGSDTIDGSADYLMDVNLSSLSLVSDGTSNWHIV